ncbi:UPF0182 family protein [Patescibacteria group bacterium]|nr:UPF0182 family protein [Patescibacteria group bacterium]MBU1952397.1 UPF0182 family protein [Patescibacteria group bacterium]
MNRSQRVILATVAAIFVIAVLLTGAVSTVTDWLWFSEIGHQQLFITPLVAKLSMGFGVAIVAFILLMTIFSLARKFSPSSKSFNVRINTSQGPKMKVVDAGPIIRRITAPIVAILSVITGIIAATNWETVLLYFNSTSFNSVDPLFQKDISYYFFSLPFIELILNFSVGIVLVGIIGSFVIYLSLGVVQLRGGLRNLFRTTGPSIVHAAKRFISILLAILFFIIAAKTYFIEMPSLLYSTTGSFLGAGYTDIHITVPILQISAIVALLVGLLLLIHAFKSVTRMVTSGITIYLLIVIVGGWAIPGIVQRFIVLPNELVKETPYIEHNIAATQKAYGIDKVEKRDLTGETTLTNEDIQNNQLTIQNIRLWDREPLLDTFSQLQEIRTYYDFVSVDNDRYIIDGNLRQILLSVRELNAANLPQRNFINEHLTFTHGYGLTVSPVNEVTPEGLPVLFVKDLPPESSLAELKIETPEIYYGELANDYVIVNSDANEFDYPSGEENVYSNYTGNGGVEMSSMLNKLLFALRFKSTKLFLSDDINNESRLMMYRDIDQRVRKVAPFLKFDLDPYLIISESGNLVWMYDAYTTSDRYPYAERVSDQRLKDYTTDETPFADSKLNYIRNSVKITIDAYTGKMQLYVSDPNDPIIQTYQKVFPETFKSLNEMPQDLRDHIRYPEDLFVFQTNLYSVYHMDDPQIFYNKEDQWQIPIKPGKDTSDPMMRHMIMKLPEEEKEEFILMLPFTPRGKDNLAAWMVVRNDNEHYGQIVVYRFPKQKLVFGPQQIMNRINQDPDISRQISLWDQRGSQVVAGNLLVIPIEGSLIYVQPIYIRAEGGRIPELKRVIVAYENRIAMETTLEQALARLFGEIDENSDQTITAPTVDTQESDENLLQQATDLYNSALEAQRGGDWTTYGTKIDQLGSVLNKLLLEQ